MSAVTLKKTLRNLYTWSECTFPWTDLRTQRTFLEFGRLDYDLAINDEVKLDELHKPAVIKNSFENFTLSNEMRNFFGLSVNEDIKASETYWDNILFIMNFIESFIVSDGQVMSISKKSIEPLQFAEFKANEVNLNRYEQLSLSDEFSRTVVFTLVFLEELTLNEIAKKDPVKKHFENFSIGDFFKKQYEANNKETIHMDEKNSNKNRFVRQVMEAVGLLEQARHSYQSNHTEALGLIDSYIRACQGVISDICVSVNELSLEDFKNITSAPPGYDRFVDFNVGEYEYEKALVRLFVEAGSAGSEPVVYDAVLNVDIDDTIDRGNIRITNITAPTKIYFNKKYYTKPEVTVTLQGGNTGDGIVTPNIVAIEKDDKGYYFSIELLGTDGGRKAGYITWSSVGY